MVEAATVDRLLETIERRLARLEEASGVPLERYRENRDLQDIVERNFELAIQAAIDLGLHLLADEPHSLPETNRRVFTALAGEGFLNDELAADLSRMAGFRNVLAHEYAEILPEMVYRNLGRLSDIREYVRALLPHLRPGEA